MDEKEKLAIANLIEDKKSLWTVVIVLMGGVIGLVASMYEISSIFQIIFRTFFSVLGLFVWYFMVMNLINVTNQIKERLKK